MARIFTEGFETGDTTFWTTQWASASVNAGTVRSGVYSYSNDNVGSPSIKNLPNSYTEFYFRSGVYNGNFTASYYIFSFRNGSTNGLRLQYDYTTQKLKAILDTSTVLATGVINTIQNAWHLIEIYIKVDNAVGRFVVKVDGLIDIDFTGDTLGAASSINAISYSGVGSTKFIDDLALNDTSGSVDKSWCGDGKIVKLVPNANGSSSQWLGSDGNNTDNYQLVDEIPPSDSDYVRATGSGYIDEYGLSNVDFAGQTIQRIWMISRGKSDASGDYFLHGIKTSGTSYLVTGSLGTSFGRIDIETTGTWALNPYTGGAWSQEQLDNLLLVIKAPG